MHDDVIKWKHFPRYWPFVRGIHRLSVNSPHKGQWRGALMFALICVWINAWVNNREAGDVRRHRTHYDVIVMGFYTVPLPHKLTADEPHKSQNVHVSYPTMRHSERKGTHIVPNCAFWDMGQVSCGICEIRLFLLYILWFLSDFSTYQHNRSSVPVVLFIKENIVIIRAEIILFSCIWCTALQVNEPKLYYPACRTTLVATRFRVAVICPIIQVPHCIRVFFYFVSFVFINHIFQFYYELCTYCNILDIYLS